MKRHALADTAVARSRALRRAATPAEQKIWRALKETFPHLKFRRQVPMGPYIVDFLCHSARLIIEADGGQHDEQQEYDAKRTAFLEREGYRVLRFWNNDVEERLDGVMTEIGAALESRNGGRL